MRRPPMTFKTLYVLTRDHGTHKYKDAHWGVVEGALYVYADMQITPGVPNVCEVAVFAAGQWVVAKYLP